MIKYTILVILFVKVIDAANILVVAPTPNVGQWLYIEEFIKELLLKGHTVTGISSYNARRKNPAHTEIILLAYNKQKDYPTKDVYGGKYTSEFETLSMEMDLGLKITEHVFKNPKVVDLIKDRSKTFDLVIVDHSYMEAFFLFAKLFKCPLVTISPSGYTHALDATMGLYTPTSFVPHASLAYTEKMTFKERCYNSLMVTYEFLIRKFSYLPAQNKMAQTYFKGFIEGTIPNVKNVEKEISLMLVNHHKGFNRPRPTITGQIDVGGAHIRRPVLNFPDDIKTFLETAENGVIIVSFGSYFKFHEMPNEKLNEFLETFRGLKQRVILKSEVTLPNLPPNVMALKWLAQSDLLAHEKVVLFIGYGETLSVQEAISRGVPILTIPFFNVNHRNAALIKNSGFGFNINFDDITQETLLAHIEALTENPQFKEKAVEASKRFHDYAVQPMNEAIFWIEYVIRNKGANYLKSPSVEMSWFTYIMFDVALFFFGILLVSSTFSLLIMMFIVRRYRSREQKGKFKYY